MVRLCLALLMVLVCLPDRAAAAAGAQAREQQDQLTVRPAEYPHDVARSADGLELLQSAMTRRQRTSGGLPAPAQLHTPSLSHPAALLGGKDRPRLAGCRPVCERLAYYPTAPPRPR